MKYNLSRKKRSQMKSSKKMEIMKNIYLIQYLNREENKNIMK
ncbi:unnamed protein product [Paramecium primaurelia]|uniref:Uncharacterized protein n=1 Tax=Paramecium primaurelia TaxID=5886 RepID=A0A8S1QQ61_PARPR|nr:unnamed protein product [Paramecium primaurelia]